MRDTARAPQLPNNRATNEPARPIYAKKAFLGPNLASFGPKVLIFTGGSKSFGAHVTEKPNGPKMPIFGQKCQFWAKFCCFWAKIHF